MIVGIIPARLNSTRFKRKILADILGKPMVVRTADSVKKSKKIENIYIAVDDKEVFEQLKHHNYDIVMTSNSHISGTERVSEVAKSLNLAKDDIIINIQADEPLIDAKLIDELASLLEAEHVKMASVASTCIDKTKLNDTNIVKVYLKKDLTALDFSRTHNLKNKEIPFKHLGIYGFKKQTLENLVNLPASKDEISKKLEQMRAIENNIQIHMVVTDTNSISVDTEEDYKNIVLFMKKTVKEA